MSGRRTRAFFYLFSQPTCQLVTGGDKLNQAYLRIFARRTFRVGEIERYMVYERGAGLCFKSMKGIGS